MQQFIHILKPFRALASILAGCLLLSGCVADPYWDNMSVSTTYASSGYGGDYVSYNSYTGYGNYMYDSAGFPIYGYYAGRPVYGYSPAGSPIFSINLLYSNCYVPSWRPAYYYRGHYHWPHGVRYLERPKPSWNHGRPLVYHRPNNRPQPMPPSRPGSNSHRPSSPSYNNRPNSSHPSYNRPSAGHRPSPNTPSWNRPENNNRPSGNRPGRPSSAIRPGTGDHPQWTVSNRPEASSRPHAPSSSSGNSGRHSRPSFSGGSYTPVSSYSGSGGSRPFSDSYYSSHSSSSSSTSSSDRSSSSRDGAGSFGPSSHHRPSRR